MALFITTAGMQSVYSWRLEEGCVIDLNHRVRTSAHTTTITKRPPPSLAHPLVCVCPFIAARVLTEGW